MKQQLREVKITKATYYDWDLQLMRKAYKNLSNLSPNSRLLNLDSIYDFITRKAIVWLCNIGQDDGIEIGKLTLLCKSEIRRMERNRKNGVIETEIQAAIFTGRVNKAYAIMKNKFNSIEGLTFGIFIHSLVVYYCKEVVDYERHVEKSPRIFPETIKAKIIEEKEDLGEFKLLKDVEEEIKENEEVALTTENEESEEAPVIVLQTKRDKKKMKKELNNLAKQIIETENEELKRLEEEKTILQHEVNGLKMEAELYLTQIKQAKEFLLEVSNSFLNNSVELENYSKSVNDDRYNAVMMNKIISARKMRGMSTYKQLDYLENLEVM